MSGDVLSDVLRAIHLTGAVYFDFDFTAPWVVEAPASRDIVGRVVPGAERVIEYHLIAEGDAWGGRIDGQPLHLRRGDLIVFPQGHPHVLSSAPGMRQPPNMKAFDGPFASLPVVYRMGGGGARTRVICSFLGCDERPFNPLLSALPPVMHLSSADEESHTGWLGTLLHMASTESAAQRPGGENVLSRLSELMFVETVRRYIATLPPDETGWLAGLRDPVVGAALGALHERPAEQWTVESLAREAGVSRSVLAERFTAMVGHAPMEYLALWRMQLASRQLTDGERVSSVASAVGYESEAAFSRAFKRLVGQSPSTWQRRANVVGRPEGRLLHGET